MPASDILNPSPVDELNPDFGWTKHRPATHAQIKPRGGAPYRRELMDMSVEFTLNWGTTADCQKMWEDIARLRRYYETYKDDGYFTLIDWESGNQRHHVGYFSTPVEQIPVGHNRWAAQNVTFVEVPGASMLSYPSDWINDGVWKFCLGDPINGLPYIQPAPDSFANWALLVDANSLSGSVLQGSTTNSWLQFTYVGWGFQFYARKGPSLGIANILLDGVSQGNVDMYSPTVQPAAMLLQAQSAPLWMHTVKLVCTGTKNPASSGTAVVWDALKVMR